MHKGDTGQQNIAVVYARVSSKEHEKEGFSIPAQLKRLRGYATDHRLTVIEEFVNVETAKRSGRPGLTAIRLSRASGRLAHLLVTEISSA